MNNKKENKEFQETRMELSKFICNRDNYIPIVLIKWATRGMLNITVSGKSGAGAGAVLSAITDGIKTVMIRKYDAAASMTINRAIRNLTTSTELNPSELEVLQKQILLSIWTCILMSTTQHLLESRPYSDMLTLQKYRMKVVQTEKT